MKHFLVILTTIFCGCQSTENASISHSVKTVYMTVESSAESYIVSTKIVTKTSSGNDQGQSVEESVIHPPQIKAKTESWVELGIEETGERFQAIHKHQFDGELIELKSKTGIKLKLRMTEPTKTSVRIQALISETELIKTEYVSSLIPIDSSVNLNEETEVYKRAD